VKSITLIALLALSLCPAQAKTVLIGTIQGTDHQSSYVGKTVTTEGIVTRVYNNGFIIESKSPDSSPETSGAIYIYEKDTEVSVGNEVVVSGKVEEYIPGGEKSYNLSLTQIRLDKLRRLRAQASLPKPVVLNYLLAAFPKTIKSPGSNFDPSLNAMDLWESVEHMRVVVMDASVIGPKTKYGEITVRVPQSNIEPSTPKGGVKLTGYDANAARIPLILTKENLHDYNTGDRIPETIQGNVTYSYGNYKVGVTKALSAPKPSEQTQSPKPQQIPDTAFNFASFNVESLYIDLPDEKFEGLARIIVESLHAPEILGLQEVHDNSGPTNDGTVDASKVLKKLIGFIEKAGGPKYNFLQISPENNADGGWPGANIRNAYLYQEGVTLGKSYYLQHSAFDKSDEKGFSGTRKPLVAFTTYDDEKFIFINCHLKSKGGDSSTYGSLRPALRFSETQRVVQTRAIRKHIDQLQKDHPEANIVVLGDMNDFEFSPALQILTENQGLTNLIDQAPLNQRYTYIFQGYSQVLDHILVSPSLAPRLEVQMIHVNSDLSESLRSSDHDPVLAWVK
jgi:uncharacterized protein